MGLTIQLSPGRILTVFFYQVDELDWVSGVFEARAKKCRISLESQKNR